MLIACDGGQKKGGQTKETPLYCDKSKGKEVIPITPLDDDCETHFFCDDSGYISARKSDEEGNQVIKTLNLNASTLMNQRKGYLACFGGDNIPQDWQKEIERLDTMSEGKYPSFCWAIKSCILGQLMNMEPELAGML